MRKIPDTVNQLLLDTLGEQIGFADNDNVIHLRWFDNEESPQSGFEFFIEYEDGDDTVIVRMESFRKERAGRLTFTPVEMFFDARNQFERAINNDVEVDEMLAMADLRSLLTGMQYVQERGVRGQHVRGLAATAAH